MLFKKLVCLIVVMGTVSVLSLNAHNVEMSSNPFDSPMEKVDTIDLVSSLYNGWQTTGVNIVENIPDTFNINLEEYCMPTSHKIVTSKYGPRWGRIHKGVDVSLSVGDTIYAAFSGKVRIVKNDARGYGNYIVIRHSNGLETVYGHLLKQIVEVNQYVKAGQPIGLGGSTGRSTGPHLHFETRICGMAINPELMFDFKMQDVTGDYYHFVKDNMVAIKVNPMLAKKKKVKKK